MSKAKIITAIGILVILYIAATPYIAFHHMKSAAERRDDQALSEYIEFASVRQNLKDQLNAAFMKEIRKDKSEDQPFAALGTMIAGVMFDKIIDKILNMYVTPAGIALLMSGEKPALRVDVEPSMDFRRTLWPDASMSYESLDKFVIRIKDKNNEEVKFILRRRGLGWKLTEILIPFDE